MSIFRFGGQLVRSGGNLLNVDVPDTLTTLQSTDIEYLGLFKVATGSGDQSSANFTFSRGCITGRRVGANLQLFITGNNGNDRVIEVIAPTTYGMTVGTAPTATLVRNWGNIYGGKRLIAGVPPGEYAYTWGLKWYNNGLYWAYSTSYEGTSWNPSMGLTELNDSDGTFTAYGPWRASIHSGQFNAGFTDVPEWAQTAYGISPLAQIPGVHCQNGSSPWGCSLWSLDNIPTSATPADPTTPNTQRSVNVTALQSHNTSHRQSRGINALQCIGTGPGATTSEFAPEFGGGGAGASALLDWATSGQWITTSTKHGVLFIGQLVDTIEGYAYGGGDTQTHNWYGSNPCPHGQSGSPMYQATGPGSGTVVHQAWIYNPYDYIEVVSNGANPWSLTPTETFRLTDIPNVTQNLAVRARDLYQLQGMHFDSTDNKLYIVETDKYNDSFQYPPVVHVFQVT